jgi:outer membrane immunogenic protein
MPMCNSFSAFDALVCIRDSTGLNSTLIGTKEGEMKKLLLAATALALASGAAFAADMSMPTKAPMMAPPPSYSWTGCYVDGGAGYALFNEDHYGTTAATGPLGLSSTTGGRGWLGRVGAGCDYQLSGGLSKWVIGGFGDYDFMNVHGNLVDAPGVVGGALANQKENWAWGAGGRVGYILAPGILSFFDAGYTQTHFQSAAIFASTTGAPTGLAFAGQKYNGWFLGSGFETSLASMLPGLPAGLFLRTEYRYSSFKATNDPVIAAPVIPAFGAAENIKPQVQSVMTTLVYRFNWH